MVCCEVALMKLGFYLLNIQVQVPLLDLFAYAGYKFVGFVTLIITIPFNFYKDHLHSHFQDPAVLECIYLHIFHVCDVVVWFLHCKSRRFLCISLTTLQLRSIKYIVFPDQGPAFETTMKRRKLHFMLLIVLLQICLAWFLI
jgi:hypothetical protein